ncbi:MAG: metal ABC transporter substrate-binding protein [Actinomycetota bacterium]
MFRIPRFLLLFVALATFAAACGDDDETSAGQGGDVPTVVVTTNILGDVVEQLTDGNVNVVTIMPVGADPHDFEASAQQVDEMQSAEVLIVNGASFEEGLLDIIEGAEADGVMVYEAISAVSTIEFGEGGHDDHGHDDHEGEEGHDDHDHEGEEGHDDHEGEEGHDDHDHEGEEGKDEDHDDHDHEGEEGHDDHEGEEGHDDHEGEEGHDDHEGEDGHDDHGHDHSGEDPHFFTDPARMALAVDGIAEFLVANVDGIDADAVTAAAEEYHEELEALDAEVQALVDGIPAESRVLITNHAVFGYFADNYGFEVAGAVIPSGSTQDSTSAAQLVELAELIEAEGVAAIFSDTSASDELIQTLADEVGGTVQVVPLFTESLGDSDSEGATYVDMVRTNATRIAEALAS